MATPLHVGILIENVGQPQLQIMSCQTTVFDASSAPASRKEPASTSIELIESVDAASYDYDAWQWTVNNGESDHAECVFWVPGTLSVAAVVTKVRLGPGDLEWSLVVLHSLGSSDTSRAPARA